MLKYDSASGEYVEDGQPDPFARPVQQQNTAAPFQSAPTAPPIYAGQPGSSYTDWNGQQQTTPAAPSPSQGPDLSGYRQLWAQSGQNEQAFIQAVIGKLGLRGRQTDPTALNTIVRALQTVGVNASLDSRTDQYHKGIMLNGQFVKLLDGSDNWMYGAGGSDRSNAAPMSIDQSYLSPFTRPVPQFGGAPAFSYADFQGPTAAEVEGEPGRQFRLDQGRLGIETAASAKGLLNSGGTLADILNYSQQAASAEYQNIFTRKRDTYNTNRSNAADIYNQNYFSQTSDPFAKKLQTYDREQDAWYRSQQAPFDKLYSLSQLGYSAAAS